MTLFLKYKLKLRNHFYWGLGTSSKCRLFSNLMKNLTKSGHRSFAATFLSYLGAFKVNDF